MPVSSLLLLAEPFVHRVFAVCLSATAFMLLLLLILPWGRQNVCSTQRPRQTFSTPTGTIEDYGG